MARVALALAIACVLAVTATAGTLPGRRIAIAKGTGTFAIAVAHGQVAMPKALYAKLTGKIGDGTVLVDCLVGTESTPATYVRSRPGLFRFPVRPAGADICHMTATIVGRGNIVAELRAAR